MKIKQFLPAAILVITCQLLHAQKPNILWIVTDDQRADAISCFNKAVYGTKESPLGYVSSPNIDAFAKEGVLFTNAYCNSPGCAPSRASMITGKYPHHSGIYGFEPTHNGTDFFNPVTPHLMQTKGYNTARFGKLGIRIANWQGEGKKPKALKFYETSVEKKDLQRLGKSEYYFKAGRENGKVAGKVEEWFYPDGSKKAFYIERKDGQFSEKDIKIRKQLKKDHDILRAYTSQSGTMIIGGIASQPTEKMLDAQITQAFKNYLNNPNKTYKGLDNRKKTGPDTSKPQFINLGYHFPHTPVLPPLEFRKKFEGKKYKIPDFSKEEVQKLPKQLQDLYKKKKIDGLTYKEKQQMIRDYYAFCAFGDQMIGDAIKAFKKYCKKHQQEYLILMACGDHGWQLGEQGSTSKFAPYHSSNHTTVIVASSDKKKFPANSIVDSYVEFVDFAPTFIAAAGEDVNSKQYKYLDGYNLAEVVNGKKAPREYVLGEMNQTIGDRAYIRGKDFAFSMRVRKGYGKPTAKDLVINAKWYLTCNPKQAEMALYDLRTDKNEQNNVAYNANYLKLADWFRKKLGNIVLGDHRIESDWKHKNLWKISNFSPNADDKKLKIPTVIIPTIE
ncbi:sulfatase-like hydrolase/transferase [Wenyingzhuangia sp. IMCC45574]